MIHSSQSPILIQSESQSIHRSVTQVVQVTEATMRKLLLPSYVKHQRGPVFAFSVAVVHVQDLYHVSQHYTHSPRKTSHRIGSENLCVRACVCA